jgi:drug/metabolite transporter (DMT)-like permease
MSSAGFGAAFLATVSGSADTALAKYITNRLGMYRYAILILGLGLVPTSIYFIIFGLGGTMSLQAIAFSLLGSVFFGMGFVLFYTAMKTQQITHAAALGEVQPVLLLLFGVLVLGETITVIEAAASLAIFVGAFLVMTTSRLKVNLHLVPIILANVSWALYWIFITYAMRAYGGEGFPILLSRFCAFLLVFAFAFSSRKIEKSMKKPIGRYRAALLWSFLILSAVLDSGSNLLFGFVVNVNLVAVGAAILAVGPLLTLILGRVFFGDTLDGRQKAGFVLAVIGAIGIVL